MFRIQDYLAALTVLAAVACDQPTDSQDLPTADVSLASRVNDVAPAPADRATITFGDATLSLWPYLATNVSGTPNDPVNMLFIGQGAEPRAIRAALLALDGNRAAFGFPASAPFDCRWTDTPAGDVQAGWTDEGGWLGSAIQLQCGDYAPIRFHLRLLRSGRWTVGGAHFEVLIPGTADHQVLSWELAEQLVTVDMMRSGLLDPAAPVAPSGAINPAPSFRTIPAVIFNGLPPALQAVAAGAPGNSATDVPIASDGHATIVNVAGSRSYRTADVKRQFTISYGQVVPKPFCNGPADYIYIEGPITLVERAYIASNGDYVSSLSATGRLRVTPVNPMTGQPSAEPYFADVSEWHGSVLSDSRQQARSAKIQAMESGAGQFLGRLTAALEVDSRGVAEANTTIRCGP